MPSKKTWRDSFDYSVYVDGMLVAYLNKVVAEENNLSQQTLIKIKGLYYTKAKILDLICKEEDSDRLSELVNYVDHCDKAINRALKIPHNTSY